MNTTSRRLALVLAGALSLGACYHATYRTGLPAGGAAMHTKVNHFVWGLAGGDPVDAQALCHGNVSAVETEKGFLDLLITGLTGALWSPTSVTIECAGATASR